MNEEDYIRTLPLVQALWWFIENSEALDPILRLEMFFGLRERYRNEVQHG